MTATMSIENESRKLDARRRNLELDYYCVECARFYESGKVKTWLDFIEDTGSITVRCPRGHIWEE